LLLRNSIKALPTCREVTGLTADECMDCARTAASRLREGWLRAIGAPDYRAYLAHHAMRHPDIPPMNERDYVKVFIERRYNRRGAASCC
jgi:uncharacterized short protein YbdD (DUF466 family)